MPNLDMLSFLDIRGLFQSLSLQPNFAVLDINAKFSKFIHSDYLNSWALTTSQKVSLLLSLCLFAALSLLLVYSKREPNCKQTQRHLGLDAAQALSTVFTPTSVAWPLLFLKLFSRARMTTGSTSTRGCIEIDLSELLSRIYDGKLELRDSRDLALLLKRQLSVYSWDLRVTMQRHWWIKTAQWIAEQHFVEQSPRITTQGLSTRWPIVCGLRIASSARPSFDLDFVPYHDLQAEIQRIQELHRPGNATIIEISCLGPGVRLMSSDFILCAVPFLQKNSAKDPYMHTARINRTSMPLFMQIHDVVTILTSSKVARVKSIVDISYEHAETLYKLEWELVNNRNLRTQHIEDVGLPNWRGDRLTLAWEAGLLSSRLLVRWRITLGQ